MIKSQLEQKAFVRQKVSVITKVVSLSPSAMTQFDEQVRIRLISQLIKGISIVLKNCFKYFNGIATSAFIIPRSLVLS